MKVSKEIKSVLGILVMLGSFTGSSVHAAMDPDIANTNNPGQLKLGWQQERNQYKNTGTGDLLVGMQEGNLDAYFNRGKAKIAGKIGKWVDGLIGPRIGGGGTPIMEGGGHALNLAIIGAINDRQHFKEALVNAVNAIPNVGALTALDPNFDVPTDATVFFKVQNGFRMAILLHLKDTIVGPVKLGARSTDNFLDAGMIRVGVNPKNPTDTTKGAFMRALQRLLNETNF